MFTDGSFDGSQPLRITAGSAKQIETCREHVTTTDIAHALAHINNARK